MRRCLHSRSERGVKGKQYFVIRFDIEFDFLAREGANSRRGC